MRIVLWPRNLKGLDGETVLFPRLFLLSLFHRLSFLVAFAEDMHAWPVLDRGEALVMADTR